MQSSTKNEPDPSIQSEQDIGAIHFLSDDILKDDPKTEMSVCGLNLACAWPLPHHVKNKYNRMCEELKKIDKSKNNFYIYPYKQTHITIATFINFKNHQNPSRADKKAIRKMVRGVNKIVKSIVSGAEGHRVKPFAIELGPLELSPKAGIIRIKNPSGEIARLRSELEKEIKKKAKSLSSEISILNEFNCPNIIHSTILRFKNDFNGGPEFAKRFLSIRSKSLFGKITINKLLLTTETKPYMRAGKKRRKYLLKAR